MRKYLVALTAMMVLVAACGDTEGTPGADGSTTEGVSIEQIRPVIVTGTPLPLFPEAGLDPAVGMAMPELEGASFDGSPISITNDGRPKVLLFLTHW